MSDAYRVDLRSVDGGPTAVISSGRIRGTTPVELGRVLIAAREQEEQA